MTGSGSPSAELVPALAPFAAALSEPALARLARDTYDWLIESADAAQAERRVPALVTVASVYARLCAPARATERDYAVAARFTLLFFLVDDAELHELPELLAERRPWSIGPYTSALRAWLADFREQHAASAQLRERFSRAYHDYLAARKAEHAHKLVPLSVAEHWAFRRRSIFMDPYLDLWMILGGIEPDALAEAPFAEARSLAIDLVLLANDLGSAERDSKTGASPDDLNLIHSYAREHGESEAAARDRLIDDHNQLLRKYLKCVRAALLARPGVHAERYADLLGGVIEGNVASVRALGFRYPGAEPIMARLSRIRP